MLRTLGKLMRSASGATAVEYGLILALIFVAVTGGVSVLGSSTHGRWGDIANKVAAVEP